MDMQSDDSDFEPVIKKQVRKSITGKKSRASCLDKLEQLDKEPTLDTISECETSDEDLFNSTVKRSSKAVIKSDTEDEQDTLDDSLPAPQLDSSLECSNDLDWAALETKLSNDIKIVEIKEGKGVRQHIALGKPRKGTTPTKKKNQMSILAFSSQPTSSSPKTGSSVRTLTGSVKNASLKSKSSSSSKPKIPKASCPLCNKEFPLDKIEAHADICADTLFTQPEDIPPPNDSLSPLPRPVSPLFTSEVPSSPGPPSPIFIGGECIRFSPEKRSSPVRASRAVGSITVDSSQEDQWEVYKNMNKDKWSKVKSSQESVQSIQDWDSVQSQDSIKSVHIQDEGPQSSQEALWNSCSRPNSVNENSMEDLPSFRNDVFDRAPPSSHPGVSETAPLPSSPWCNNSFSNHSSDSSSKRRRISHTVTPVTKSVTPGSYPSSNNNRTRGALRNPDNDPGTKVQSLLASFTASPHITPNRVSASRTTADDRGDSYTLGGGKRKKAGKTTNTLAAAASSSSSGNFDNSFIGTGASGGGLGFKLHPFLAKAQPSGGSDVSAALIPDADGGFTIDDKVLEDCTEPQAQFSLPSLSGGFIDFDNQFKEKSTPRPRKAKTGSPKKKRKGGGGFRGRGRGFRRGRGGRRGGGRGRGAGFSSEPNYTF